MLRAALEPREHGASRRGWAWLSVVSAPENHVVYELLRPTTSTGLGIRHFRFLNSSLLHSAAAAR